MDQEVVVLAELQRAYSTYMRGAVAQALMDQGITSVYCYFKLNPVTRFMQTYYAPSAPEGTLYPSRICIYGSPHVATLYHHKHFESYCCADVFSQVIDYHKCPKFEGDYYDYVRR